MALADQDVLRLEVLKPAVIEEALDVALDQLASDPGAAQRDQMARRLATIEGELLNLSETAALGGAVPAIVNAIARRDEERRQLGGRGSHDRAGGRTSVQPRGRQKGAQGLPESLERAGAGF